MKEVSKRIYAVVLSVLICMSMVGCNSGIGMKTYEGANMRFKYKANDWSVAYRAVGEEHTIIELRGKNGGALSILSCESETTGPEKIYETMTADDEMLGEILETASNDNMSDDGGSAAYSNKVESDAIGDYWTLVYGKNAGEGKVLLAVGIIYEDAQEEDASEEATEECMEAMQGIMDSLKVSETAETGEITESVSEAETQTLALINYITGGKGSYNSTSEADEAEPAEDETEPVEDKAESAWPEIADLKYLQKVEFVNKSTNLPYTIYAPLDEDDEADPYGIHYYNHGVHFAFHTLGQWNSWTAEDALDEWLTTRTSEIKEYADRYQNMQVEDKVILEENRSCYQHIAIEEVSNNGDVSKADIFGYVGTAENDIGYRFRLEISQSSVDSETNALLEEMSQVYGIDLTQCGVSNDTLTNMGDVMDTDQEDYEQVEGDEEVRIADGFSYLGTADIENYKGTKYEVYGLRGKYTSASTLGLYGNMHGITMNVSIDSLLGDDNLQQAVERYWNIKREVFAGNSRDYKNIVEGEFSATKEGGGLYGVVSADYTSYDGETFPQHEISYGLPIDEKNYIQMSIELDEREYDSQTNDVLKEIEEVYQMDLSDFYYEP
ncbi:MAG TPA: hypothetical protein VJZ01_07130 [Lachnospiraceae bacterium]|nr:hypothetical protein [Lachnospiraceae bacterium]